MADSWTTSPEGGFLHGNYQNNAVSYFIGLDAGTMSRNPAAGDYTTIMAWDRAQDQAITGDRNIRVDGGPGGCSAGVNNAWTVSVKNQDGTPKTSQCAWTNAVHGLQGNLAILDGSVSIVNQNGLIEEMRKSDDNGSVHFLMP